MLRCGFFMQNLNTTHRTDVVEHNDLFVPAGGSRTAFIDARDIGAVAARVLTEDGHEGQAYSLTGSEALTYHEVAAIMSEELGRPITYSSPSLAAFARRMRRRGHSWSYVGVMEGVYLTTRLGMAATVQPDAAALLGRRPITMWQYVRDYSHLFEPNE
jgi:nucleoside-diphosphate-sugar epimerase